MKNLFLLIIFINYLFAANPNEIINRQIKDLQEKQIFEQQKSDKQINNKSFETNLLNVDEDVKEDKTTESLNIFYYERNLNKDFATYPQGAKLR